MIVSFCIEATAAQLLACIFAARHNPTVPYNTHSFELLSVLIENPNTCSSCMRR